MKPREIHVHIDELVLHGLPNGSRHHIAEALQSELSTLLEERGIPASWHSSPETLQATAIRCGAQTNPAASGKQIAHAVHGGTSG